MALRFRDLLHRRRFRDVFGCLGETCLFLPVLAVWVLTASAAAAADEHYFAMNDQRALISVLENPERDVWQKPAQVVEALGDLAGKKVVDIGAGSGYFTLPLARKAGLSGVVFAIDIEQVFLDELESRAAAAGITNVRAIAAPEDDPALPPHSVHVVFMCNTYPLLKDRLAYAKKINRILKAGGRFAIVSYNEEASAPDAPPPQKRVSRQKTVDEVTRAGFVLAAEHTFLPYQHFLVFEKPAETEGKGK